MECTEHFEHPKEGECSRFFPNDIEELLRKLVCQSVVLTYRNGCKERVRIECISGCLLVVKEDGCYRFINIDCICGVGVSCDTILNAILGPFCDK